MFYLVIQPKTLKISSERGLAVSANACAGEFTHSLKFHNIMYNYDSRINKFIKISRSARLQVSTHMMTGFSFTVFFQHTNHSFIVWFIVWFIVIPGLSLLLTVSFSCIDLSNLQSC